MCQHEHIHRGNYQLNALHWLREFSLNQWNVRPLAESDVTRYCKYTIEPPEDEHNNVRNMYRIVTLYEQRYLCINLVIASKLISWCTGQGTWHTQRHTYRELHTCS